MSTAVFFGLPVLGHSNPSFPLIAELVTRGETVIYYAPERFRLEIEQTGAEFRGYGADLSLEDKDISTNSVRGLAQWLAPTPGLVARLLPEIRALQPDYVMYDSFATWGRLVGEILSLPRICSTTTFAFGPWVLRYSPAVTRTILVDVFTALGDARAAYTTINQLHRRYGVRRFRVQAASENRGDLTLVYTSRAFQPFAQSFDSSYRFVGPSLMPRRSAPAFPLERLRKPMVYIALGSIPGDHLAFFRTCLAAFADGRYQLVIAAGHDTPLEALAPLPEHVLMRAEVPQLEILPHASLFITHGGMNSASEALYHGVPMVVLPRMWDQFWVAKRVVEVGAGKRLDLRTLTPRLLRRTVDAVLAEPAYAAASARLGAGLRAAGGYRRAADEIEAFLSRRSLIKMNHISRREI